MFVTLDQLPEVDEFDAAKARLMAQYGDAFDEDSWMEALERQVAGLTKDAEADYPWVVMVSTL